MPPACLLQDPLPAPRRPQQSHSIFPATVQKGRGASLPQGPGGGTARLDTDSPGEGGAGRAARALPDGSAQPQRQRPLVLPQGTLPRPPPDWPSQGSPRRWGHGKWKLWLSEESCWEPPALEAQPRHPAKYRFQPSPSRGCVGPTRRQAPGGSSGWGALRGTFAFSSPVGTSTAQPAYGVGAGTAPPGPRGHPPTRWSWAPPRPGRPTLRHTRTAARGPTRARGHHSLAEPVGPSRTCPHPPGHFILSRNVPTRQPLSIRSDVTVTAAPKVLPKGVGHGPPGLRAPGIPGPPPRQGGHTGWTEVLPSA